MHRRTFLKLGAATGFTASLAGCPDGRGPSPTPTREPPAPADGIPYEEEFETVVDLQRAGADPDAAESIVPLLDEHVGDDTLVYLPPGRYLVDETVEREAFENLGIVGRDAVIVPGAGFADYFFDLGRPGEATGLRFEGLTFDFHDPDVGSRTLSAQVADDLVVRDLVVAGTESVGGGLLRVDVTDGDGEGLVEGARFMDGAADDTSSDGCQVGDKHEGTVRIENCRIEGFPDNGLYADPEEGSVQVVGGYYANCNVACIRIANDSVVRGARVLCDSTNSEYGNMRGIRLTHAEGALIENCLVEMKQVPGSDGGISLGKALESATVRNTQIRVDADRINAILVKHPENAPADEPIRFENVEISGSAAEMAAVEINRRENCTFDGVTVVQDGRNRNGLVFEDASKGVVRNCRFEVTGAPIVTLDGSTVCVSNSIPAELNGDASAPASTTNAND